MAQLSPLQWSEEQVARWLAFADELHRRLGTGTPLPVRDRRPLEARLGHDLTSIVVHHTPLAGQLARAVGAEAVSMAAHLLAGESDLDSGSARGAGLLGHELTHAVQSTGALRLPTPSVQRLSVVPPPALPGARDEEATAQHVEAVLAASARSGPAGPAGPPIVDADALADRVYRRMVQELIVERERAAGVG